MASTPTGSPLGPKYPPFTPATAPTRLPIALTRSRPAIRPFDSTPCTTAGSSSSTLIRSGPASRTIDVHCTPGATSTADEGAGSATAMAAISRTIRARTPHRLGCARDPVRPPRVGELHEGANPAASARAALRARARRSVQGRDTNRRALRAQPGRARAGPGARLWRDHSRIERDPPAPRGGHAVPPDRAARAHARARVALLRAEPHRGGAGVR